MRGGNRTAAKVQTELLAVTCLITPASDEVTTLITSFSIPLAAQLGLRLQISPPTSSSSPVASALPGINRPFPIHQPLQLSIPQVHQSPPPPLSGIYRGARCPLINATVIVRKFCLHLTLLSVPIGIKTVNKARKRDDILGVLS